MNGPVEPSADLRQLANALRQAYVALTAEGFTSHEALIIVGQMLIAGSGGGR